LIERYILHRKPKQTIFEYLIKRKGVWKVESVFFNKNDFFP
jgi:hypothetical protein